VSYSPVAPPPLRIQRVLVLEAHLYYYREARLYYYREARLYYYREARLYYYREAHLHYYREAHRVIMTITMTIV